MKDRETIWSVFALLDPSPLDAYTKNPDAEVFVAVDHIYPTYEKVW